MKTLAWYYGLDVPVTRASNIPAIDRVTTFDKLTNVHYSGTAHDEDQPSHLIVQTEVCSSRCGPEYGHPCTRFCPANVYEIIREPGQAAAFADQRVELRALQDVRHHGPVSGHHLGASRRWRRSAVQRHVAGWLVVRGWWFVVGGRGGGRESDVLATTY
jgi:ferredoxin-like protein FixX